MNNKLKLHYNQELANYQDSLKNFQHDLSWNHLKRAHILSQFFWKEHFFVHCLMLSLALKTKNLKEILGQIPRLMLAIPGSVFGRAPKGNVGTSDVGIFEPMDVPKDLAVILESEL